MKLVTPHLVRRGDWEIWHLDQEALRKGLWLFAVLVLALGFVGRQRDSGLFSLACVNCEYILHFTESFFPPLFYLMHTGIDKIFKARISGYEATFFFQGQKYKLEKRLTVQSFSQAQSKHPGLRSDLPLGSSKDHPHLQRLYGCWMECLNIVSA